MQNKYNFPNAKNITKKNRNSSKSLKTKNENEMKKFALSNSKELNYHINNNKDSFSSKFNEDGIELDKLTAKKTSKLNLNDIDNLKNNKISPRKINNCTPPIQSKNKNYIKNTKSILEKENETSNIKPNNYDLFKNGKSFNSNHSMNYDFLNLKNSKKNNFGAIIDKEKKDLYLGKTNYVSPFNEKTNKDNNLNFESDYYGDRAIENDKILLAKKRNRDRSSSSKSMKNLTRNPENNKNFYYSAKVDKKIDKISIINEMEIEEETKDNSNNNEACNNYAKYIRNNNNNFYGNDFENLDRIDGINYRSIKNKESSDDEINFCKKKITNKDFDLAKYSKNENNLNRNRKESNSPRKKRKKTSNKSSDFCFEKEVITSNAFRDREENNDDSCPNCFLCSWEYPKEMDFKDKNEHVNYCADGEGEKHKKMYGSSQRLIKIAINSQEEENSSNKKDFKNKNAENLKEKGNNYCHICSKRIYLRNGKTIDEHVLQCYKEKEDEIFNRSGKK